MNGLKRMAAALALAVLAGTGFAQEDGAEGAAPSRMDRMFMKTVAEQKESVLVMLLSPSIRDLVNVNARVDGTTPLIAAAAGPRDGWLLGAEMLLDAGADPNGADDYGKTALMAAAETNSSREMVYFLIRRGARINAQDGNGCTALMYAIDNGSREVITTLMMHSGADPTLRAAGGPYAGQDALARAVRKEDEETVVGLLYDYRVRDTLDTTDRAGKTAFAYALESEHMGIVEAFLVTGRIDFSQEIGDTGLPPLLWAISERKSSSLIEALIRFGDPNVKDKFGRSAWYYAAQTRNLGGLRMLEAAGGGKSDGE